MPPLMGVDTGPLGSGIGFSGPFLAEEAPDHRWALKPNVVDSILSMMPERTSPKIEKNRLSLDSKHEISEASLSEGFTFPLRDPPRPGQFTNIPQRGHFTMPLGSPPAEPRRDLPNSSLKNGITDSMVRASPLNLPEIGLSKPTNKDNAPKRGTEAEVSQKIISKSIFYSPPDMTKPRDLRGSQIFSPKDASDADKAATLLSPPKPAPSPKSDQNSFVKKTRSSKAQRQSTPRTSTPSICGDLEGPTYRSPRGSQLQYSKDAAYRPRTHGSIRNTSSNISKKRSRVGQPPSAVDSVRKIMAMENVTNSWNDCMRIAHEENSEAHDKIERLEYSLKLQHKELEQAAELLRQKNTELGEIENLCKKLSENSVQVTAEKEGLASELTSLREELSEEKKQGKLANEKFDAYRHKLNETIKEQGVLFRRAQAYYQDTMGELREENARKTASSDTIDKALKSSLKIREEMKKCTEEYRIQMEKDTKKKDQMILELKEKLKRQEALAAQEKLFADKLRSQTEGQDTTQQCIRELEAKVDALMAHHAIQDEQRESDSQQNTHLMGMLNMNLESLLAGGNLLVSKMLSHDDLELKLADTEQNIVDGVLQAILSVKNEQGDIASEISQLSASIGRNFDRVTGEASQMMDALEQHKEGNNKRFQELLSHMQTFESNLEKAENSCGDMSQKLGDLASSGQSNQRETTSILQDLLQRVSAHEIDSSSIERQLKRAHEDFIKSAETMISDAMGNGDATDLMRSATDELRATLEQGLGQEREKTAQLLQGSDGILKLLTAYIDEQKQLATHTDHNSSELQETLKREREAAAQLKCKIQELEQKAQETEELSHQWLKDVQMIGNVRSQLKAIELRVLQAESCDKKLDRIVEISKSIQSSASYLATEKEWVQLELASKMSKPTASETTASCEITTSPPPLLEESSGVAEIPAAIREDATSRKVTVHSPDPGERSPSPPLTVMQEQKRRREFTQLRSILKSHAPPGAVESGNLEGNATRPQTIQSKASQPPSSSLNKPASTSANEMVAEIRSKLLQHKWTFPTVAEFERDIELTSRKRQAPQVNETCLELIDTDHRQLKKLRTEDNVA
ncbi:hypothetical protein V8C35DRAFT_319715 [Trichoderma chlorosporum]